MIAEPFVTMSPPHGDSLPSHAVPPVPEPPRFLSEDTYRALFAQVRAAAARPNMTNIMLDSQWRSDVRWARNRTTVAGDWRNIGVVVKGEGEVFTNQIDRTSLEAAVHWPEQIMRHFRGPLAPDADAPVTRFERKLFPATYIWSDATYTQSQDTRLQIANHLIASAEVAGMLSAGYLSVGAHGYVTELPDHRILYAPRTAAQCSMTVRDPEGTGSGWAGVSSYDWNRIDAEKLAAVALDKCLKSRNPVRVEPGRYTVVMEPQATFDLVVKLWRNEMNVDYWDLFKNMNDSTLPFHAAQTRRVTVSKYGEAVTLRSTKLGERIIDPRLNISFDPIDPDLGCVPFIGPYPIRPVRWVTNGVLTTLSFPPSLDVWTRMQVGYPVDPRGALNSQCFRIDGGAHVTSVDDMIATTARGLLVTRFWGVQLLDVPSVLCTGMTRDGLWLIEHGKITHPVTNLRFTESPIFALNQVEQVGAPVPVFSPELPALLPPLKVRDFSFTSLEDAV